MTEPLNAKLAAALVEFHKQAPTLRKDTTGRTGNQTYQYADLHQAVEACRPILAEHGLMVLQFPTRDLDGTPALRTMLLHVSGESLSETMRLPGNVDDAKALGASITYCRRYAYCAVLSVVADEDTDGVPGSGSGAAAPDPEEPPVTKGQIGELRDLLASLEAQEARRGPTWAEMAQAFASEQLGVAAYADATEAQAETINNYLRGFLKDDPLRPG